MTEKYLRIIESRKGQWTHVESEPLVQELVREIRRLQQENEILVWNLGGCSTYAMGYGLDEDHSKDMARPALDDVRKLALKEREQRQQLTAANAKIKELEKEVADRPIFFQTRLAAAEEKVRELDAQISKCESILNRINP